MLYRSCNKPHSISISANRVVLPSTLAQYNHGNNNNGWHCRCSGEIRLRQSSKNKFKCVLTILFQYFSAFVLFILTSFFLLFILLPLRPGLSRQEDQEHQKNWEGENEKRIIYLYGEYQKQANTTRDAHWQKDCENEIKPKNVNHAFDRSKNSCHKISPKAPPPPPKKESYNGIYS